MRLLTGMRAWTLQRTTALLMLGFTLWLAGVLLVSPPEGYEEWRSMVAQPAATTAFAVFFVAVLLHAWVGIRDAVLDYVHNLVTRATALLFIGVALFVVGVWLALALAALHVR